MLFDINDIVFLFSNIKALVCLFTTGYNGLIRKLITSHEKINIQYYDSHCLIVLITKNNKSAA